MALIVLGFSLRWDITRIECRSAALKRLLRSLGGTYCPYIRDVSTYFLLVRQRLVERLLDLPDSHPRSAGSGSAESGAAKQWKRRLIQRGRFRGRKTGGGGPWRILFSKFLRGKRFASKAERALVFQQASRELASSSNKGEKLVSGCAGQTRLVPFHMTAEVWLFEHPG